MSILKRFGVVPVAVAALVVPLGLAAVTAAPAAAHATCSKNAGDIDDSSWGTHGYGANQREGSSTSCVISGEAGPGDVLDYHCYTWGNDGYTWTFLRNDTDGTDGWVRDDLLGNGGSGVYCGF